MSDLWSQWTGIDQSVDFYDHAVYQLRYVDSSGAPRSLGRVLGTDPSGILYIGQRASLEQARLDVLTGIENWDKHMAGIMIHILATYSDTFRHQHKESNLQYRFEKHASEESRKRREERLIKEYVVLFGEVPPLNSAIPKRNCNWIAQPGA